MHPGQLPGDPEPGLVEVRDLRGGQRPDDRLQRRADEPGDLPGHRRQRGRGRCAAEHLAQRGAGPVPRQELPVPQVHPQRRRPRPVLHRRGHPLRRPAPGHRPAGAQPPDHLVLDDLGLHRRDLRHLPPDQARLRRPGQVTIASGAARWLVPDHVIGMIGQPHRRARLPLRPTRPAAGLLPQRLRRRLAQAVRGRWPRGVLRVLPHPGRQVSDLRPELCNLLPQPIKFRQLSVQRRDLCISLVQQLPQPGIGGTQPGSSIRHAGRIRHRRHYTTISP